MKIYPDAVCCTGQLEYGVRFSTNDSPEKVMQWYREQYPQWSVQGYATALSLRGVTPGA